MEKKKLSIIGIRGIPARYGGFETLIENLAPFLVREGFKVNVYARKNFVPKNIKWYKGVRIVKTPSIHTKHLETITHTIFSIPHIIFTKPKILFVLNLINIIFCIPLKIFGIKIIINVDGLEWKRKKWGFFGKLAYKISAYIATKFADEIITDANVIKEYYEKNYKKSTIFIPYGNEIDKPIGLSTLENLGIEIGEYFLWVGRLEPENNPEMVINSFKISKTNKKLLMLGDNPYKKSYVKKLKKMTDSRIIMPGGIYGVGYSELLHNCFCFIHSSDVGGTHPALVEAMGAGKSVLLFKNSQNFEVAGDSALYFKDVFELKNLIEWCDGNSEKLNNLGKKLKLRAEENYSWKKVLELYKILFSRYTKDA